jgi:hypothetical protein
MLWKRGKRTWVGAIKWRESDRELVTVGPHTVSKLKEPRTLTARLAAQNSHWNTSYGSSKKQRKKDERVIWRKRYGRKEKKEQKCG